MNFTSKYFEFTIYLKKKNKQNETEKHTNSNEFKLQNVKKAKTIVFCGFVSLKGRQLIERKVERERKRKSVTEKIRFCPPFEK